MDVPNLGGRSPQDLLTGDDHDREFLGNVIATIEQGASLESPR